MHPLYLSTGCAADTFSMRLTRQRREHKTETVSPHIRRGTEEPALTRRGCNLAQFPRAAATTRVASQRKDSPPAQHRPSTAAMTCTGLSRMSRSVLCNRSILKAGGVSFLRAFAARDQLIVQIATCARNRPSRSRNSRARTRLGGQFQIVAATAGVKLGDNALIHACHLTRQVMQVRREVKENYRLLNRATALIKFLGLYPSAFCQAKKVYSFRKIRIVNCQMGESQCPSSLVYKNYSELSFHGRFVELEDNGMDSPKASFALGSKDGRRAKICSGDFE